MGASRIQTKQLCLPSKEEPAPRWRSQEHSPRDPNVRTLQRSIGQGSWDGVTRTPGQQLFLNGLASYTWLCILPTPNPGHCAQKVPVGLWPAQNSAARSG